MGQPAARVGDMHTCPMVTPGLPPVPHVGGPVLPPGVPNVLIGGLPAATVGCMCVCVGPPDVIIKGSLTVLIGGRPAARMGDNTAHGGVVVMGFPTVLIGDVGAGGTPIVSVPAMEVPAWQRWLGVIVGLTLAVLGIIAAIFELPVLLVIVGLVGAVIGLTQLITGRDIFTGEKLTGWGYFFSVLDVVLAPVGGAIRLVKSAVAARRAAQAARVAEEARRIQQAAHAAEEARRVAHAAEEINISTNAVGNLPLQFGKNENQLNHAFRHVDELGLDRVLVQSAIKKHISKVASEIEPGKPFNQIIEVAGKKIQYTAFKLPDGTINIGRIHGTP